jgi:hypothetical protein
VTPFLLAAVVSMTEMPSAHTACCVRRALEHGKAAAVALAKPRAADDREKTALRTKAPLALPAAVFRISPLVCHGPTYVPPALAPRAPAATPSSQRDPPDSPA